MNAEFIITDSFHGTCFSLIFNKKFISIKNRNKKRFDTLLNLLKNTSGVIPIFDSVEKAYNEDIKQVNIDFYAVNKMLDECRKESNNLLCSAFLTPTKKDKDSVEMNINYIELWRQNFNVNQQLNTSITLSFGDLWKSITANIQNALPMYLQMSTNYTRYFYQIFFKGINRKIHYELLILKNTLYFCVHCEDVDLQKYCRNIFLKMQEALDIRTDNPYIINVRLNKITDTGSEVIGYINKLDSVANELYKIQQIRE